MTFLPLTPDEELSGASAAAAQRRISTGVPLSNVDRALLGHLPSFQAYAEWDTLKDELVPYIGERAVTLFAHAIVSGSGSEAVAARFRRTLLEGGEDPDDPQVTETERLLLDWGHQIASNPASVTEEFAAKLERAFSPKLRLLLVAFAGQTVGSAVFASVGRIPIDDELKPYRRA